MDTREMRGETWEPGCPVPPSDLALLRFNYVAFDGSVALRDLQIAGAGLDRIVACDRAAATRTSVTIFSASPST